METDDPKNPIDELIANSKDFTLDAVVNAREEMSKANKLAQVNNLRRKRALWVAKRKS